MSEKKEYTPQEAAVAVLAKVEEILKKSGVLEKSGKHADNHAYNFDDNASIKGVNKVLPRVSRDSSGKATGVNYGHSEAGLRRDKVGAHKETLAEMHSMPKPNLPKSEEAQDEVKETQDPSLNPKEMAGSPGTNEEWGTSPKTYSTLKLAKFLGHLESKRRFKKKVSEQ